MALEEKEAEEGQSAISRSQPAILVISFGHLANWPFCRQLLIVALPQSVKNFPDAHWVLHNLSGKM